jgi:hypothetical protein
VENLNYSYLLILKTKANTKKIPPRYKLKEEKKEKDTNISHRKTESETRP